jgi:hypothetical protein
LRGRKTNSRQMAPRIPKLTFGMARHPNKSGI